MHSGRRQYPHQRTRNEQRLDETDINHNAQRYTTVFSFKFQVLAEKVPTQLIRILKIYIQPDDLCKRFWSLRFFYYFTQSPKDAHRFNKGLIDIGTKRASARPPPKKTELNSNWITKKNGKMKLEVCWCVAACVVFYMFLDSPPPHPLSARSEVSADVSSGTMVLVETAIVACHLELRPISCRDIYTSVHHRYVRTSDMVLSWRPAWILK